MVAILFFAAIAILVVGFMTVAYLLGHAAGKRKAYQEGKDAKRQNF